jgi:RimJ/RimL family protein N-acetyltransferase
VLEGKNVNLRLFAENDLDDYLELESREAEAEELSPAVARPVPLFKKEFAETGFWEEHKGRMVVTDKKGRMIGTIMFFRGPGRECGYEIGFVILRREDRGRGYMTEALRLFSSYLFEIKRVPRLEVCMFKGHEASRRVVAKCGFQHEGTLRKAEFLRGQWHDLEVFSILREECPSLDDALRGRP